MGQSTKTALTTEGILLQEIPYLGKKKILKILSPEHGLISLFTNTPKFSPFCIAEWVYRAGSKEIHPLLDASLIDPLLTLKTSYELLLSAGQIVQDLLKTQVPGKKAPYRMAAAYLQKLPLNPPILAASFRLKLLIFEGLFPIERDSSFSPAEWEEVLTLAFAQKFSLLSELKSAPHRKIELFFKNII